MKYCLTYELLQEKFPGRAITSSFEKRFNGLSLPYDFTFDKSGFAFLLIGMDREIGEMLFTESDFKNYSEEWKEWRTLEEGVNVFMKYYRGKLSLVDKIVSEASR